MIKTQQKKIVIEQLQKMPVIEVACSKANISRATFYRWKQIDKKFAEAAEKALSEGTYMINDLAESQLISAIRDKTLGAISLWLKTHHINYSDKLEISGKLTTENKTFTPEQEALIRKAFDLANFTSPNKENDE